MEGGFMTDNDLKANVRSFIVENFLFGEANGLANDTSFLEEGIIDSTGVLELIEFLESSFDVQLDDDEIIPENLDSIEHVANFLQRKMVTVN
jgi:acyl carrier protein